MRSILFVATALLCIAATTANAQVYGWLNFSTPLNRTAASQECINTGGWLATFPHKQAWDTFRNAFAPDVGSPGYAWLGGSDAAAEGTWLWDAPGSPIPTVELYSGRAASGGSCAGCFCNFNVGEPNHYMGQNHLALRLTDFLWDDLNGATHLSDSAICQYSESFPVPANAYVIYDDIARNRADADTFCTDRCGWLAAFPNTASWAEFETLYPTAQTPVNSWIAGSDNETEGTWKWSATRSPYANDIFYTNNQCQAGSVCPWGVNEPNSGASENFLVVHSDHKFNDAAASSTTAGTICQFREISQPATTATPVCTCPNAVTADYKNTLAPDAAKQAYTSIALNTNTWEVEFAVHDVLHYTNGHVIAAGVDAQNSNVTAAIESLVSAPFETSALWNPPSCGVSGIDTPAAALDIAMQYHAAGCTRSYHMVYSLIDANARAQQCQLSNTAGNEVLVECEVKLNSIRAYDLTIPNAFLAKETVFRANITMPRNLPNEVSTLLHASLAKCSVYAAPEWLVDCRIPALWNFGTTFAVDQTPTNWIIPSSCVQTNGTDATYIRCDLQSISQIYTEVAATISATVLPSGEVMRFAVNYSLPREETATATGALASFVKSIGTKDGKFFYGNDDLLTLEIEVVDTSRLQITQLELFNSDAPVQTYNLRTNPEFEVVETAPNSTFFVITFYPARMLRDSTFYRHGPHGVNVSFLFTAARRQQDGETGVVTVGNVNLKGPKEGSTGGQSSSASTSSSSATTIIAAAAAGSLIAVVAIVGAAVALLKNKKKSQPKTANAQVEAPAASKEASTAHAVIDVTADEV